MKERRFSTQFRALSASCLVLLAVLCSVVPCRSGGRLYAIVGKSATDLNFVRVYEAARAEALRHGDRVILVGGQCEAHFRIQDAEVSAVLKRKPDGLAISVLHSRFLAENSFVEVRRAGIPVVTFDSDFSHEYSRLRAGYVGTDNEALGQVLAREVRRLRPGGGCFAILTGGPDVTNTNDRIRGVMAGLFVGQPLHAWKQYPQSPLPCRDNYDQSLDQLENLLTDPDVDVVISVGWWAQMAKGYERRMGKYKAAFDSREKIVVFAGAIARQREMLDKGLGHVNVGLNFEEMGRLVYRALSRLASGGTIPPETWTPMNVYRAPGDAE